MVRPVSLESSEEGAYSAVKMTPTQALFHTMSAHFMRNSNKRWPGPGQLVAHMAEDVREALSRLTSEEAQEVSVEYLGVIDTPEMIRERKRRQTEEWDQDFKQEMERRYAHSRLRLMFDRKLRWN